MSITDYAGRTSDYVVLRFTKEAGVNQLLNINLLSEEDGGQLVTGLQKLLQRFVLVMFTRKGTVLGDPTRGTNFMVDALLGRWKTAIGVRQSFVAAQADARRQLIGEELQTDPLDERYDIATLDSVTVERTAVNLHITVKSMNKTAYKFIAPITVTTR